MDNASHNAMHQHRHEGDEYRRIELITGGSATAALVCGGEGGFGCREPAAWDERVDVGSAAWCQPRSATDMAASRDAAGCR